MHDNAYAKSTPQPLRPAPLHRIYTPRLNHTLREDHEVPDDVLTSTHIHGG